MFIISFVFIIIFSGCIKYCGDGVGSKPNYDNKCTFHLIFKDTSNRFSEVKFFGINDYTFDTNIISFNVNGLETNSSVVVKHKQGIDTIFFNIKKSGLKYDDNSCNEHVYFDIEGLNILKYTFDSVYFKSPNLIIE